MPARPSWSSAFAANLVTLLLVLTAAAGLFVVVRGVVGAVNGDQEVAVHRELNTQSIQGFPPDTVNPQRIPITVRVEDATAEQSLYAMARDLIPVAIILPIFWLLRGILRSVRDGDPFIARNVRRLRAIGFVLLIGAPVAAVATNGIDGALASTIGADGSGLAINLPGAGPIAALAVFVLAQVFADGIRLRDDVEATI